MGVEEVCRGRRAGPDRRRPGAVPAGHGRRRRRRPTGSASSARSTTGEESLAAAAELHPDLVLMDVNLPGIDGIEATRRLTATPDGPVVVLLSTYDEDQVDARGLRRGGVRRQGRPSDRTGSQPRGSTPATTPRPGLTPVPATTGRSQSSSVRDGAADGASPGP